VNSTLSTLEINRNGIANHHAKAFAKMVLPVNSSLEVLVLRGNAIRDTGVQALIDAMKTNVSLVKLDVSENKVTDKKLEDTLRKLVVRNLESRGELRRLLQSHLFHDVADSVLQYVFATSLGHSY